MANKQKILIVDDDENIANLISLYLTKECYETRIEHDGQSALDAFKEYAGNEWSKATLKSKAWSIPSGTSTVTAISATCKIYASGSVEVTYAPDDVKNYVKEGK